MSFEHYVHMGKCQPGELCCLMTALVWYYHLNIWVKNYHLYQVKVVQLPKTNYDILDLLAFVGQFIFSVVVISLIYYTLKS